MRGTLVRTVSAAGAASFRIISSVREITRTSLGPYQQSDLIPTLLYDAVAEDHIREMIEKEQICCAFLSFDLTQEGDVLKVTITAPEDAREAADLIFDQFTTTAATPVMGCGCRWIRCAEDR